MTEGKHPSCQREAPFFPMAIYNVNLIQEGISLPLNANLLFFDHFNLIFNMTKLPRTDFKKGRDVLLRLFLANHPNSYDWNPDPMM